MLKLLRRKDVSKKLLWVVAIVIILSFGLFGTATLLIDINRDDYAGRIFGKKIAFTDFEKAYQHQVVQSMIRYGQDYRKIRQYLNIEGETWNRLILLHEANRRNIKIPDAEVVRAIQSFPFFQRDGRFEPLIYEDVLQAIFRIKPRSFEEGVRENLKIEKLFEQVTEDVRLNPEAVRNAFEERNQKVQVSYVAVDLSQIQLNESFPEDRLREHYNENKMVFLLPRSLKIAYVEIPKPDPEETGASEPADNAKANAETLFNAALTTGELERAAQTRELSVKETPFFSADQPEKTLSWPLPVLSQIITLGEGDVAGPFETDTAYIVVQAREIREAYLPPFEEVRDRVQADLNQQLARDKAAVKAEQLHKDIQEALKNNPRMDLAQAVESVNPELEIKQTPSFTRGQYLPSIGTSRPFQEAAFGLTTTSRLSDVVPGETKYFILYLDQFEEADPSLWEQQKDRIRDELLAELQNEEFNKFLSELYQEADHLDRLSQEEAP